MESKDRTLTIQRLCARVGMSRQAFYKGERVRGRREVDSAAVLEAVRQERRVQWRLGGRKLHVLLGPQLAQMGVHVGRDRLFDILRERDLLVEPLRSCPQTTDSRHFFRKWPNLLRHIVASMVHQVWVADLTYVRTEEGFLFLSLLTDAYSRKIVGYYGSDTLEAEGCLKALEMALAQLPSQASPIHHSDRGSQYCCGEYVEKLLKRGIAISMTEVNHCYENGKAERINGILKGEYGLGLTFRTKAIALSAIDYAVSLYNERRPHMALGYRIPAVVHSEAA